VPSWTLIIAQWTNSLQAILNTFLRFDAFIRRLSLGGGTQVIPALNGPH
jgi:hypothetical protein